MRTFLEYIVKKMNFVITFLPVPDTIYLFDLCSVYNASTEGEGNKKWQEKCKNHSVLLLFG